MLLAFLQICDPSFPYEAPRDPVGITPLALKHIAVMVLPLFPLEAFTAKLTSSRSFLAPLLIAILVTE